MSNYCLVQDVRNALTPGGVAATDENQTAASMDSWQLNDAIQEAMGVVDTYLLTRYVITTADVEEMDYFVDPPALHTVNVAARPVRGWTRDIAAYLAALTFRRNKDLPEDDPIRLRYTMVVGLLTDIRDRTSDLPGFPTTEADDQGAYVQNLYDGTMFTPQDFKLAPEGYSSPQILWPGRF